MEEKPEAEEFEGEPTDGNDADHDEEPADDDGPRTQDELREDYEDEIVHRAEQARYERQHDVLLGVIDSERLQFDDLMTMIRLGIIADDEDWVPCEDGHRSNNSGDWDEQYEEALLQRRLGEITPLEPSTFCCPLMSQTYYAEVALPCIVAQREQASYFAGSGAPGPKLLDPDDPVVATELRPCLVLGHELLVRILSSSSQRKHQQDPPPTPPGQN